MAFKRAEGSGRKHPFKDGAAGCAWFDGFKKRHPKLICAPHNCFLMHGDLGSANPEILSDYLAKLWAVRAKLNLLSKPIQTYNMGITVVHKPG